MCQCWCGFSGCLKPVPFPVFDPVITRDFSVVLVGFAVAFFPGVILAAGQLQPGEQLLHRSAGTIGPVLQGPVLQIVNDAIACVRTKSIH